jgi:uncharacterized protein YyaL (SSP411 family)
MKKRRIIQIVLGLIIVSGGALVLLSSRGMNKEDVVKSKGKQMDAGSENSKSGQRHPRNRLANEKSPYLLQHADNPIDWYPWGEEAFARAGKEDKPIFLSVGYSACHWCHVMEEESFEDQEVAGLMNEHFVAVKVDREERPDVDRIYMSVCQAMTGSGGWPLTVVMTPQKKPFFAGTYFPKEARYGRPGLMEVLEQIASLWKDDRQRLLQAGDQVTEAVRETALSSQSGDISEAMLQQAYDNFSDRFDLAHGGFGGAPKFPTPHNLTFLLRWWKRSGQEEALIMVERTLDAMWRGGLYDHLGFGFHRYSTDERWLVPHFEKMLYDQALLAMAYVEAYQATGKEQYAEVAREVFGYVLRDMTAPKGGFYSSEDADSEGQEGKFYVWTEKELSAILGSKDGALTARFYGLTAGGNFEDGGNILHRNKSMEEMSAAEGLSVEELDKILQRSRKKLFTVREKRVRPAKDDKVLADWNGLMIAALAKGARVLDQPDYARAAVRATDFLLATMRDSNGRLLHRYRLGEAGVPGYADDYAFLAWGLVELYEATFQARYLRDALDITDQMLDLFWDDQRGGLYFTARDGEDLIARTKESYDGAVPSGNSVAALNLLRLSRMTMRSDLQDRAEQLMRSFAGRAGEAPTAYAQLLIAVDFALGPANEIVIAGELQAEDTRKMLAALRRTFLPRKVVIFHPDGPEGQLMEEIVPWIKEQSSMDGRATAYVCQDFACQMPTSDAAEMLSLIESDDE